MFRSLDQNGRNPRIYSKTCFNDKPKLTLTYFNIIKDMRESRNFRQGGPGQSDKKGSDVFVFFYPQLILQKSNGQFQRNLSFFKVPVGAQHFPGGGGVQLLPWGVQLLIPHINPYNL